MADVVYPSPFERRVLAGEAPGGPAVRLELTAPTVVRPGERFALRLAAADADGYPSVELEGTVTVRGPFAHPPAPAVRFEKGTPAVARVDGLAVAGEGLFRFEAELDGRLFRSNPLRSTAGAARRVFWGDPHVHTVLSDCHPDKCRSAAFCYVAARWFSALDWVAAADHVSNGRCELARWKESAALSNAFDEPPAFATLPGYEASFRGGAGGDNNFYMLRWPDLFVEGYEDGDVRSVCEALAAKLRPGEEFFVVPHHTTRTGKHGEIPDAIWPGERLMPVVEIHSKWGTSEYRGNPNPLKRIHPGPSYVADLLARGLPLGFIAGTDTHATMPAGFGIEDLDRPPGLTAVLADDLSRRSVFDAIRTRNCYAASLERTWLQTTVAGVPMGRRRVWADPARPREIRLAAAARGDIERIDIVRNGQVAHCLRPGTWRAEATWRDEADLGGLWLHSPHLGRFVYYYVRLTCASGAQAWSSPVWLTAGPGESPGNPRRAGESPLSEPM